MLKSDSSVVTLLAAAVIAGGFIVAIDQLSESSQGAAQATSTPSSPVRLAAASATTPTQTRTDAVLAATPLQLAQQQSSQVTPSPSNSGAGSTSKDVAWSATAAGRVEPRGGTIDISPEMTGTVVEKYVEVGDRVKKGDLLYKLRDDEIRARWDGQRTELDVRKRERAEDPSAEEDKKKAEKAKPRVQAETDLGEARLALYQARRDFDAVYTRFRGGTATRDDVEKARKAQADAETNLEAKRTALDAERAKEGMPLPTRLEGGYVNALDELRVLEIMLERTRVRAPSDGVVLDLSADVGETVAPSPMQPLAKVGDLDKLTVRSELEERDLSAVAVGQDVVVRSSAFPGRDFAGKVKWVAPSLAAPKLSGRGPRQLADVDVLELTIDLEGRPPLLPGMRVDVFFKPLAKKQAAAGGTSAN